MFLKTMNRAMRYYRFWIYSCNIALLVATLIYLIAFICVLNDDKMMLFPSIKLYEPTFLYSYCAIILQGGVLQSTGPGNKCKTRHLKRIFRPSGASER
ncbi:unnamed protein product [Oppiella nova]|uniref:Uncharacterized protein n=1 Tax=Oppiella nova TaxID=334625 RepID=A0A7R9LAG9_9ACAR|nr:unnamed protein product [Oppiella nova]CAG2161592.1 unnamed protein product [Oppiella nova]